MQKVTIAMIKISALVFIVLLNTGLISAKQASIRNEKMEMDSYMFSDPDPVANPGRIYPYFRFDGYTNNSVKKEWNMVVLENEYIQVYVCPDIGGKIWGAIEKSTGKEFLYFNHVVKFRDVAMRGAWTSGGLEYNFGDVGHIPTCATPVDYQMKENNDGSVSCIVGAIDLPSRTKWNVEIKLEPGKAYFKTIVSWFNNTQLPCTYYHWMNAAAKSGGNLEFIYPGNKRIGHGGELGEWPIENERDLSFYENNDFGFYKSYHIINSYSDFFGGYWHDDDFGFGHQAAYDAKPGKKLWIWGLSDQGMIWEDLLTDNDGQYIEYQAGKLFNQAAHSSTITPFKHKEFTPYDTDVMHELWFPLKETNGMVDASEWGVLNVEKKDDRINIYISALQSFKDKLVVKSNGEIILEEPVNLNTLQLYQKTITIKENSTYTVEVGNRVLFYSSDKNDILVERPIKPFNNFNWESSYGLYTKALEMEKQRRFADALNTFLQCLEKEPGYLPALNRFALGYYRKMNYAQASNYINRALAIDAYDGEANYLFGLINQKLNKTNNAKSGFSIATASVKYRNAAYTELAAISIGEKDFNNAIRYAKKAMDYNQYNITALELLSIAFRKTNETVSANQTLEKIEHLDETNHFFRFEKALLNHKKVINLNSVITNELIAETYLEIAINYYNCNCLDEAMFVLNQAPAHPIVLLWKAYLDKENESTWIKKAFALSPYLVFPHRTETAGLLDFFIPKFNNWKLKYYKALILWNKGLIVEARELFEKCDHDPDYYPFYLAKAKLFADKLDIVYQSLQKSRKLAPEEWRSALALVDYYQANDSAEKALQLSKNFCDKYPENAMLGMRYAESLIQVEQFEQCVDFLENYNVLPFEGATIGREFYHEACIRSAMAAIKSKKYDRAVFYAHKAKKWPRNLGAGKPYDVDERIDDYITALAYSLAGNTKDAELFYHKVTDFQYSKFSKENSKLLFQLFVLDRLNKSEEAEHLFSKILKEDPDNQYIKWVGEAYKSNKVKAEEIADKILSTANEIQPYDITFIDKEFQLVLDFYSEYMK